MPKPRKALICLDATPYYHCVSRCVRRAFLCGADPLTGKSFEHRRGWIRDRLLLLAEVFAIDLCAYAVMSNHTHVVLHVDREQAMSWGAREVLERWTRLFSGNDHVRRYLAGEHLSEPEQDLVYSCAREWRARLMSVSWFMRSLNEAIARRANEEDGCTGRFWEGRFRSQALLDDKSLAACLAYVDLNPVRAGMAETPEQSDYTSVQERLEQARGASASYAGRVGQQPRHLMPFAGNPREAMPKGLPFRLSDYLELVEWTGRIVVEGKCGAIAEQLPPVLERLQMAPEHWLCAAQHFESRFKGLVGGVRALRAACQRIGYQRTPTLGACAELFA